MGRLTKTRWRTSSGPTPGTSAWSRAAAGPRSIVEELLARGIPAERVGRLKAPAGLDLGAVTPAEIAASILAEIVQVACARAAPVSVLAEAARPPVVREARDPVCGMSVDIASAEFRSEVSGQAFYFCCGRCKRRFDQEPARYVAGLAGQRG